MSRKNKRPKPGRPDAATEDAARGPGGGRLRRPPPTAPPPRTASSPRAMLTSALSAFRARPIAGGAPEATSEATTAPEPIPEPTTPLGKARRFADRHPLLISWIVLAVGMVAILVYTSRDVGLLPSQLFAMVVATVLLAGACVWIISWE